MTDAEAVARKLCEVFEESTTAWEDLPSEHRGEYLTAARAVIEVLNANRQKRVRRVAIFTPAP